MMNPFMSYTQSFNESMTKDDREDAERRMATVKPVTAGIATPTAIQAAQNGAMTKDDREDAERRMLAANSRASYSGPLEADMFNLLQLHNQI